MNESSSSLPSRSDERRQASQVLEDAFVRYQDELLGTMYFLVGNREDARDALQEAFVKCWRHVDQVADVENIRAWIFRIALNTGRDMRKTAWRRKRVTLPGDESMLTDQSPSPADSMDRDEQLDEVRQAIAKLRPEEQEIFLLRQNGELTYEQIASAIGIPSGTVKTRMRLALSKLRAAVAS